MSECAATFSIKKSALFATILAFASSVWIVPAQYVSWRMPPDWSPSRSYWVDVNGDERKELFLVSGRELRAWAIDPLEEAASSPTMQLQLPEQYLFYCFASLNAESQKELFVMSADGVDRLPLTGLFEKETATDSDRTFTPLVRHQFNIKGNNSGVNYVDFFIDLDGDGVKELAAPVIDGYAFLKKSGTEWNRLVTFGSPEAPLSYLRTTPFERRFFLGQQIHLMRLRESSVFPARENSPLYYFSSRWPMRLIQIVDLNDDGRLDLKSSLQTALQTSTGTFRTISHRYEEPVFPSSVGSESDLGQVEMDIDGDGRLDQIKLSVEGEVYSNRTTVKVWLNPGSEASWDDVEPATLRTGDFPMGFSNIEEAFVDVDGDGDLDLALIDIQHKITSVESNIKAFFDKGLKGRLNVYIWEDGEYTKRPGISFPLTFRYDVFGMPDLGATPIKLGHDFDADGKPDLLVKTGASTLAVHRFIDTNSGFDEKVWQTFTAPGPIDTITIESISEDGHADVILDCQDVERPGQFDAYLYYSVE